MPKNTTTWSTNITKIASKWVKNSNPPLAYLYDDQNVTYDSARYFQFDFKLPSNELSTANLTTWNQT